MEFSIHINLQRQFTQRLSRETLGIANKKTMIFHKGNIVENHKLRTEKSHKQLLLICFEWNLPVNKSDKFRIQLIIT